ncbi:MAG: NIF family HAD-type phosphatase [Bacteriovoracaceae bacterium]
MKKISWLLSLVISVSLQAGVVLSPKVDEKFGGYYLQVQESQKSLSEDWGRDVSVSEVLYFQSQLRTCLQLNSNSFFRQKQTLFMSKCLKLAEEETLSFTPSQSSKGLTVVFDMDETLLTQWSKVSLTNPEKTSFKVKYRDLVLNETKEEMTLAPWGVTIRPKAMELLKGLAKNSKIERIVFFTAREDRSAQELADYFLIHVPELRLKFKSLYARNSLRLDSTTNTPSKDLRLIAPDLKHVLLIDDNPSRVIQKSYNFSIPKFNADLYLTSNDVVVKETNNLVMPFIGEMINQILDGQSFEPYSTAYAEQNQVDWGREILKRKGYQQDVITNLLQNELFHQVWIGAETVKPSLL